jgi:hypothetical protein
MSKQSEALDRIYDWVDDLLLAGKFEEVNKKLGSLHLARLAPVLLVGWLTASLPAKSKLPNRQRIYEYLKRQGIDVKGLEQ